MFYNLVIKWWLLAYAHSNDLDNLATKLVKSGVLKTTPLGYDRHRQSTLQHVEVLQHCRGITALPCCNTST